MSLGDVLEPLAAVGPVLGVAFVVAFVGYVFFVMVDGL